MCEHHKQGKENPFRAAVVTVSDTCFAGTAVDTSGPQLQSLLGQTLQPISIEYVLVPDEQHLIEAQLKRMSDADDARRIDLILTTGGTGFGSRDRTPEATRNVMDREAPQLAWLMASESLKITPLAVLSRSVCAIRKRTLIVNMPGSRKAVSECYAAIVGVLPHALQHMFDNQLRIRAVHAELQQTGNNAVRMADHPKPSGGHSCPHVTGTGKHDDRNSTFAMESVAHCRSVILRSLRPLRQFAELRSPMDLPPFRASIKDGYAMRSDGQMGTKRVIGFVAAGDPIRTEALATDECFKINTGAAVPRAADCIVQVEDTELAASDANGAETEIRIRVRPRRDLDIRPVGNDLRTGETLLEAGSTPGPVALRSLLASIGRLDDDEQLAIGIISTGDELVRPGEPLADGKVYDTNNTMLVELCRQFGFHRVRTAIALDTHESLRAAMQTMTEHCAVTICTGGVSMGDKDFVKAVMVDLGFHIFFGRVNMKPGKPMTFAANDEGRGIFGLPGNPVSAFVTFHLFVLPALRRIIGGYARDQLELPVLSVQLMNDCIELDPRPEYVRARIVSRAGELHAEVRHNQMSSCLKSIYDADVLLHFPGRTGDRTHLRRGARLKATVLKHHFISKYE